jgi:fructose-specific phosphotransferase system IIC component
VFSVHAPHINRMVIVSMNGESRKQVLVAVVSLAVGAAVAGVLSNSKARGKLVEGSKKLVDNFRKSK